MKSTFLLLAFGLAGLFTNSASAGIVCADGTTIYMHGKTRYINGNKLHLYRGNLEDDFGHVYAINPVEDGSLMIVVLSRALQPPSDYIKNCQFN